MPTRLSRRRFFRDGLLLTIGLAGGSLAPRILSGLGGLSTYPHHFRDIHTTILHTLGLNQDLLTFPHLGRDERLTLIEGEVIHEVL